MNEPLLLIHGFTDTPRTWDPLLPLLADRHQVLAPALVGHRGGPPAPRGVRDAIGTMADALERLLDDAGHEQAHLVGSSLGGWLALLLAARGRALSVVAVAPSFGWRGEHAPAAVSRRFRRAHRLAPVGARMLRMVAGRPRLRRFALADVVAHPERVPPATAAELILGAANCAIFRPYVEQVEAGGCRAAFAEPRVPVRIAWGDRDRILPRDACSVWFPRALPRAEWITLPDCGHLAHHDQPALVARTVLEVTAGGRS